MTRKTMMLLACLTALLLTAGSALAQDGQGLLTTADDVEWLSQSLSPLHCGYDCAWVDLLYPPLIGIDPDSGLPLPGAGALAVDWALSPDYRTITLHLDEGLFWQDGAPVTAYDALYTLAALSEGADSTYRDQLGGDLLAVVPVDDHTLAVTFVDDMGCAGLARLHLPVIPAHVLEPGFAQDAAQFFSAGTDPAVAYESWLESRGPRSFAYVRNMQHFADFAPLLAVTQHVLRFSAYQPDDYIDLVVVEGDLAVRIHNLPYYADQQVAFLRGDLNYLSYVPSVYRADLSAADGQLYAYPSPYRLALTFNLADPDQPQPAFDEDGQPLDQGQHPIFGDVRVRRAVALALDVAPLSDVALFGTAVSTPGLLLPSSWAADGEQSAADYDPMAAAQLLEAAGWVDSNGDGVRECIGCLYGQEGELLWFRLYYPYTAGDAVAGLIANQLEQIGFNVSLQLVDDLTPGDTQRFDASLQFVSFGYTDPDPGLYFSAVGDVPNEGPNNGSYYNTELEQVLEQARHASDCAVDARAALYREAETILAEDVPVVWLYAYPQVIAVQGGIQGFAPRPFAPLWNMADWVVVQ